MSLVPISPLCFEEFQKVQTGFAESVVNYVEMHSIHRRTGWLSHLQNYDYARPGHERDAQPVWQKGVNTRLGFNNRLRASLSGNDQTLVEMVNKIMEWGGMNPYDVDAASKIRQALQALDAERMEPIWNKQRVNDIAVTRRVAARTKIFEMSDPDRWVIYDSRVATALACLTDQSLKSGLKNSNMIRWPIPQGRPNESRVVKGYPGAHTPYQASLGFLYASWLCRMIAQRLKLYQLPLGIPQGNFRTFHVEMILWTIGVSCF